MGILAKLFDCIRCKSSTTTSSDNTSSAPENSLNRLNRSPTTQILNRNDNQPNNNQEGINSQPNDNIIIVPEPTDKRLIKMITKVNLDDIKSLDIRHKDQKDIKYNCPICLKYYDKILKSNCCGNYICHFCCEEINECIINEKVKIARCSYCCKENFIALDVDPNDVVRIYTDLSMVQSANMQNESQFKNSLKLSKISFMIGTSQIQPRNSMMNSISNENMIFPKNDSQIDRTSQYTENNESTHDMNANLFNQNKENILVNISNKDLRNKSDKRNVNSAKSRIAQESNIIECENEEESKIIDTNSNIDNQNSRQGQQILNQLEELNDHKEEIPKEKKKFKPRIIEVSDLDPIDKQNNEKNNISQVLLENKL